MSRKLLTSIECENNIGWAQELTQKDACYSKKYGALGWKENIDGFYIVEIPNDAIFEGV